ncbi:hypothetical protein [Kribbella sp.]|uniref:hypothetical protein n=1 Tax=Kribbella sp. TaxID=1871183 RepID=UPI002D7724D7|nr:hypothetical protein [Kribbella sp.]
MTSPPDEGVSGRVRSGASRLYAVWPGKYRSDLFLIDDIDEYERAIGLQPDPERTGLQSHRHDVSWSVSPYETDPAGSYISVEVVLECGCELRDLRAFAVHMREQRGWNVAVTGGWSGQRSPGALPKYDVRVRRASLR